MTPEIVHNNEINLILLIDAFLFHKRDINMRIYNFLRSRQRFNTAGQCQWLC